MVALLSFAVVLVDERLLRTAVAVLPALWLAQRALQVRAAGKETVGEAGADRRTDAEVRAYVDRLLKHLREFYTTCHLMGAKVLTAEAAEERANTIEKELNRLLAEITEATRAKARPSA
jgi:hypothetical protein